MKTILLKIKLWRQKHCIHKWFATNKDEITCLRCGLKHEVIIRIKDNG